MDGDRSPAPRPEGDAWRLYLALAEHLDVGVGVTTLEGRIEHANRALLKMAGCDSHDELVKLPVQQRYADPGDAARLRARLAREGVVRGFDTAITRADGVRLAARFTSVLLPAAPGAAPRILTIIEDLTELRRTSERLMVTQRTIDFAPVCAYWLDVEGRFTYANQTACQALGYTRDELLALHVSDVNPRATPERWAEVWKQLKAGSPLSLETVHRRKDGSVFPVELISSYFEVGGREYCNGFAYELTERRRAEEERAALQAELAQAQKMESIGRLAGGVAHDFNNMLSVIVGRAELALRPTAAPDDVRSSLVEIRAVAERSAELTRQLLAFARRQPIAPQVLDLNEAVAQRLTMLRRLIGESVTLEWAPGAQLVRVRFDPAQLTQVLTNLCVNARHAISGAGTVFIETANVSLGEAAVAAGRVPGEYVRLSVRDTGEGMPPSVLAHLFEPFFTTRSAGEGTGLGLATVYGVITQNQGYVDVQSEPGKGATFYLYIPRYAGPPEQVEAAPAPVAARAGNELVLLVEDDPLLLRVARLLLLEAGYRVLEAGDPDVALRLAREHPERIDLLLTDVVMPKMNGLDLAARVRELRPGIAELYMSGYTAGAFAVDDPRAAHFIAKPFSADGLTKRVRAALEGR